MKSVFLLSTIARDDYTDRGGVWIRPDDVLEVLLLAGLRSATRSDAGEKLMAGFVDMKHFLPGLHQSQSGQTDRFCLQVRASTLLVEFKY